MLESYDTKDTKDTKEIQIRLIKSEFRAGGNSTPASPIRVVDVQAPFIFL